MADQPAGQIFQKKAAARRAGWMDPARLFFCFNLADRLASQPCIFLPPSILGGITLVLVYYWVYFPYRAWVVTFFQHVRSFVLMIFVEHQKHPNVLFCVFVFLSLGLLGLGAKGALNLLTEAGTCSTQQSLWTLGCSYWTLVTLLRT